MSERRDLRAARAILLVSLVCGTAAASCGDDETAATDSKTKTKRDAGPAAAADAAMPEDKPKQSVPDEFLGDAGEGWKTLITGHWEIEAGTETYRCVRFTLPEDVNIGGFRALSPRGTHHTVLTVAEADKVTEPDGITKCTAQTNAQRNLSGSGVGTNDFMLPEATAMRLKAGQQLLLNLHLFNVSADKLVGTSGTLIKTAKESDVKQWAEGVLAGPISLNIPVGGPTVQSGNCTFKEDGTIFAVLPHMHQLGIHMKTIAHSSLEGDVVIHDADYSFDEQTIYPMEKQVRMKAGDKVQVDCTYMNTTTKTVNFGDSSLAEMCFAGLLRYPSTPGNFLCTN